MRVLYVKRFMLKRRKRIINILKFELRKLVYNLRVVMHILTFISLKLLIIKKIYLNYVLPIFLGCVFWCI